MFMSHRAWRYAYAHACLSACASQPFRRDAEPQATVDQMFSWSDGPAFGVRRPLRHLAWKLGLSESQVREMVEVLDRIKTAHAQAKLDRDRSTSDLAQAFGRAEFDAERVGQVLATRTDAARVLNGELERALEQVFEILDEKQRHEFAYLLRSGAFTI